MHTARLLKTGRGQVVRLPKEYALPGEEVYVKKIDGLVILIPKKDPWRSFIESLDRFSEDFLDFKRDQGTFKRREGTL